MIYSVVMAGHYYLARRSTSSRLYFSCLVSFFFGTFCLYNIVLILHNSLCSGDLFLTCATSRKEKKLSLAFRVLELFFFSLFSICINLMVLFFIIFNTRLVIILSCIISISFLHGCWKHLHGPASIYTQQCVMEEQDQKQSKGFISFSRKY